MPDKTSLAIDVAVSLIRSARFIGVDDDAQIALEKFVSSLDDEELSELKEKESLSDLHNLSSMFSRTASEASAVMFEIEIPIKPKDSPDFSSIYVIGPVKNTRVLLGEKMEEDSILASGTQSAYVISEIDHDMVGFIERYAHKMSGAKFEFDIKSSFDMKVTKKTFI